MTTSATAGSPYGRCRELFTAYPLPAKLVDSEGAIRLI
jgi:hypothetical protein